MTSVRPVWCAQCKVAWMQAIVEKLDAAITAQAYPVRCPRCTCHRRVRRIENETGFNAEHPEVRWIQVESK